MFILRNRHQPTFHSPARAALHSDDNNELDDDDARARDVFVFVGVCVLQFSQQAHCSNVLSLKVSDGTTPNETDVKPDRQDGELGDTRRNAV